MKKAKRKIRQEYLEADHPCCPPVGFEPIYREEAEKREKGGTLVAKGSKGRSESFMARDSGQGEHTISRVLYIRKHDPAKYADLIVRAKAGEEVIIHLAVPKKEEQFWPGPNSTIENRVADMLLDSWNPRQIAEQLNVPYGTFLKWYMNRGVQAYLMVKRNDLAEDRRKNAERDTE